MKTAEVLIAMFSHFNYINIKNIPNLRERENFVCFTHDRLHMFTHNCCPYLDYQGVKTDPDAANMATDHTDITHKPMVDATKDLNIFYAVYGWILTTVNNYSH